MSWLEEFGFLFGLQLKLLNIILYQIDCNFFSSF